MVAPTHEVSSAALESLDFEIPCSGYQNLDWEFYECFDVATHLLSHNCGCSSFKCTDCTLAWKRVSDADTQEYGDTYGICAKCENFRDDSQTVIVPI